jgi:hypothetical protein
LEIDRRAFIANLGGVSPVALMPRQRAKETEG